MERIKGGHGVLVAVRLRVLFWMYSASGIAYTIGSVDTLGIGVMNIFLEREEFVVWGILFLDHLTAVVFH